MKSFEKLRHSFSLSIGQQLIMMVSVFILTLGGILAYTFSTVKNLEFDSIVVDVAGRQRMMIQRYLNEILLTSEGNPKEYSRTQKILDQSIKALMNGGPVVLNIYTQETFTLPSASTTNIFNKLMEQQTLLSTLFAKGKEFLQLTHGDPLRRAQMNSLLELTVQLQKIADDSVKLFSAHSRNKTLAILRWEPILALLFVLFSILLARQVISAGNRLTREVEQRKKAESERNRFFSLSQDLFCISSFDGFFKALNPSWTRTLGYAMEELETKPFLDFVHPDDVPSTQAEMQRLSKGQTTIQFENRYHCHDGTYKWLLWNATPDLGQQLIYATAHDVTNRKRNEQQLLLRDRSIESASNGILIADAQASDMPTVYCNSAFERITGYSKQEVIGQNCRFLQGQDKDQPELDKLRTALQKGEECRVELRNYKKDGSFFWNELYVAPVRNNQREVSHFVGVQTDITEAKQARLASLELAAIVESCEEAIIGKTSEGIIQSWNKGAERLYGYTEKEVLGKSITLLFPEDKMQEFEDIMGKIKSRQGVPQLETIRRRKDGKNIQVAITISPITDQGGQLIGSSILAYDITERKQREKDLADKTEELARSNQELQQFAYVASHDLQEPLRMVSSYTQLLGKRYKGKLDTDADEFIGFAVDGANRMQQLIRDLLEYSRVGAKETPIEPTDCHAIMHNVIENLSSSIEETEAHITTDKLPTLNANATQLSQLFQNLLGNAIKFKGEGRPTVHVTAKKEGVDWQFAFRDNGIGIPADQQQRIFDIFQRLHSRSEYPGTGIGLAICKKIVERHGGRIWVVSSPGEGATFYFTLSSDLENSAT